jgi:hypothetical protein
MKIRRIKQHDKQTCESNQIGFIYETNEDKDLEYGFNYSNPDFIDYWEIIDIESYIDYMKKYNEKYGK